MFSSNPVLMLTFPHDLIYNSDFAPVCGRAPHRKGFFGSKLTLITQHSTADEHEREKTDVPPNLKLRFSLTPGVLAWEVGKLVAACSSHLG